MPGRVVREAIQQLRELPKQLDELLRQGYRSAAGRAADARLSSARILRLKQQTQVALAQAYLQQGLCYPPDSSDRTRALTLATATVRPIARLLDGSSLEFEASLLEIRCLLEDDKLSAALELLQPVSQRWADQLSSPSREVQLHEARIRLAMRQEAWGEAIRLASQQPLWGLEVEHDLIALEALLRASPSWTGTCRILVIGGAGGSDAGTLRRVHATPDGSVVRAISTGRSAPR